MITPFVKDVEGVAIHGDICSADSTSQILCLHGGGPRGKASFLMLRKALLDIGISSSAFDYKGHGETRGDLSSTSLFDKVNQTQEIVLALSLEKPCTVLASSMGGYVAIKITETVTVKNLILIAPAVYTEKAYKIPFGPYFSSCIRKYNSWVDSDAFEIISKYKGNLLLIVAENDQIVPKELTQKIYDSAISVKKKQIVTIQKATHPLTGWLDGHPDDLKRVTAIISTMITEWS